MMRVNSVTDCFEKGNESFMAEELFDDLFRKNFVGVALADADGKLLRSNENFQTNILSFLQPDELSDLIRLQKKESIQNQVHRFTVTLAPVAVKLSCYPIGNERHVEKFAWVAHSSENHQQSRVLRLKNLYRSFINNTFELIFRTSLEDNLLFVNKIGRKGFGFPSSHHSKGFPVMSLFRNCSDYYSLKERVRLNKKITDEIIHFKTLSDKVFIGQVNCQVYFDESGKQALHWIVLDITKRMEYEESLQRKNAELEKVNADMEKFLYSTSHDLRSPVTSILGLVNLMRLEGPDQMFLDYLEKMEMSALRMDKIIHDLMSFTKTSYQHTKTKKIDSKELILKIIDRYTAEDHFRKIHFDVNVNTGSPFYTDPERLELILDNLIRNAIHFYDDNKVKSFVRIQVTTTTKEATIEVLDNGIGIGKDHVDHVFTMFYKASHRSKGAGLGLYIVKESLHQLNGSITLESETGFGSMFKIHIPNTHNGKLINRRLQVLQN